MPFLEDICILVWVLSIPVMGISAFLFLIRLITKKNRKIVKRVFWSAVACFLGSFLLFGLTSPVTWCKHEYTLIADEAPTCTSNGRREQYCPLCDYTKKETFDATGHNMVTQSKREPTYEADGELIAKCSVCGYEAVTKLDMLIKETQPVTTEPTEKPKTDKEIAQEISDSIAAIGIVTLEKEEENLATKDRYDSLTEKQKSHVKNKDLLETALVELEMLLELEELNNNPTYTLTKDDLVGIWEKNCAVDGYIDYYYFAENGYIYLIGCESAPEQYNFNTEDKVSTSYDFGTFDKETGQMMGSFSVLPYYFTYEFAVTRTDDNQMIMQISWLDSTDDKGLGTFTKTDVYVNGRPAYEDEEKEDNQKPSNDNSDKESNEEVSSARHTDSEAWVCAQKIVKDSLKSPSSAKFCSMSDATITHLGNGKYKVTGWVEAQNSFGTVLRKNFTVTYLAQPSGFKNGSVTFY